MYAKSENYLNALDNAVDIFSKDICMTFLISKCENVSVHNEIFGPAKSIPTSSAKITDVESDARQRNLGVLKKNCHSDTK